MQTKIYITSIRAICPTHLILLHLISMIMFGEVYNLLRSPLCILFHEIFSERLSFYVNLGPEYIYKSLRFSITKLRTIYIP
jgi:hypothetical protein